MSKGEYEKVIKGSGYKTVSLIYTDKNDIEQKRNHSRNIIWLNPPFDLNLDGLFRGFLRGGVGDKIIPCLKLVRIMAET